MKEIVCTLPQAKKLSDLGVAQESNLYYYQEKVTTNPNLHHYGWSQDAMPFSLSITGRKSRVSGSSIHKEYSAFTVTEMAEIIGRGTKLAELHWQWLLDCVNSGLSGTVALNPVALAGFLITQIENGNVDILANERLLEFQRKCQNV